MRDRPDSTSLLAELAGIPTLAIVGEQDELIPPAMSKAIVDRVPGAVLGVIPNAGHLPSVEQPLATTRVLGEFLDSLR